MIHLATPDEFEFPFKPYKIQEDFMKQIYLALEQKKCGIFESPTGTGKSLSIICGAIKWLKDHNAHVQENIRNKIITLQEEIISIESEGSDWLTSQSKIIEINKQLDSLKLTNKSIETYYNLLSDLKLRKRKLMQDFKLRKLNTVSVQDEIQDPGNSENMINDDLLLDDITTENSEETEQEEYKFSPTKIFICSRTHSQLSQFVGEIRKSVFSKDIRVISLASRQIYCINPKVNSLKSNSLINEKCLDMQKKATTIKTKVEEDGKCLKRRKTNTSCKCPYFKQEAIDDLKDSIILDVQDVEDLVTTGRTFGACPYYASRNAVEYAEVILVPYNTILHKQTREANGIVLKDNVVIIDEAHNLLDALGQMYGATVQADQVELCHKQLKEYKMKYGKRLSAINFLHINQLLMILSSLKAVFGKVTHDGTTVFTVNDFVSHSEIDHFNMFKLVEFIRNSKLSQKLHGFALRASHLIPKPAPKENAEVAFLKFKVSIDEELKAEKCNKKTQQAANCNQLKNNNSKTNASNAIAEDTKKTSMANPLLSVISFLEALQHASSDGRILLHAQPEGKKLQYLLLNSSAHFSDIVKDCRAVIVAGGTMKPISEFRDRLFLNAGADLSRIMTFSCDHIIPPENILPIVLTNQEFLFNYENRFKMRSNIKLILNNACKFVHGGIVVFFPSYKYENWVWEQVKDINFGRVVFREPQESGSVDSVLENYHKAIYKSQKRNAMLFSVVCGKLSEGLNFSDDLGRCVIVFGLPYANIQSAELKEKMAYLDKTEGSGAGKTFYENLCMKAVNQCIGRAVRHKNDYASVLLVDVRYNRLSTKNVLPDWIKRSLRCCDSTEAFNLIQKFFSEKKQSK